MLEPRARGGDAHVAAPHEAIERVARHQPSIEERGQRLPQPRFAQLRKQQRHIRIVERDAAADRQRAIQRGLDEARRFGFIGEVEAGIDAGLEREFMQQREAERIDGADPDVAKPVADLAPAGGRDAAFAVTLPQRGHHALTHLGGGFASEGDGEDVARRHTSLEEAHVAIDEHARLARARGSFERDIAQRIHGQPPRPRVGGFFEVGANRN